MIGHRWAGSTTVAAWSSQVLATVAFTARCPRCGRDATWTQDSTRANHTQTSVLCTCEETT